MNPSYLILKKKLIIQRYYAHSIEKIILQLQATSSFSLKKMSGAISRM